MVGSIEPGASRPAEVGGSGWRGEISAATRGGSAGFDAVQAADDAGLTTLTNCKLRLAQKLGQRWSAAWEPTGFPNQSTAIPSTQDERLTLLDGLKAYFTEVPANESAEMGATAALCSGRMGNALRQARGLGGRGSRAV